MLVLPTIIIALSSISGAGGIALSAKSLVDSMNAAATNRFTQEQNERNVLRFQAVSDKLNSTLEELGKQRMVITKNFSVFIKAFERIHNKPEFTREESVDFPEFDFNEIKNVSIVAADFLGATVGAIGGAVMALGTASTGTKIAELSGAAATKAALGALVEGIAMAYAGSVAQKHADKAKDEMQKNELIINDAISMQLQISKSATDMKRASVELCNKIYKPLVLRMKALVDSKCDWNTFSDDEKMLVENTVLIVQILHYLNNTPLYKVTKLKSDGEIEEVVSNSDEVKSALNKAKSEAIRLEV